MAAEIKPVLKYTFLLNFFVALGFGFTFLLFSESFNELMEHPFFDPVINVLFGAAILAYGSIAILSYRETDWEKVKNIVLMFIFWTLLSTIAFIILHFEYDLATINWINIGSYILILVLYVYSYIQQQK